MDTHTIRRGRFSFDLRYRHLRGDEGLSICVYGPVEGIQKELLRFDCFKQSPHFHTAVHDHNTIRPISEPDPVAWALEELGSKFKALVSQAGGDELSAEEDAGCGLLGIDLQATAKQVLKDASST